MTKTAKHTPGYPLEFRAEAIRLARTSGKPYKQIARDLGTRTETLRTWREASRSLFRQAPGQDSVTSEEREELRRLRRENRILREERESLVKAAVHLPLGRPPRSRERV